MRINHNIAALNTYNQLNSANNANAKNMEKLSSGLRINRAGDDAAGLAISEKMRGQIRGLDQASRNSLDGISMIQTAEGGLSETTEILQRMRELAVQAGNDTNTTSDREEIQKEVNQLTSEINRIGNTMEFNTQKLLNASAGDVTAGTNVPAAGGTATGIAITLGTGTNFSGGNNLTFDVTVGSGVAQTVDLTADYDGTTLDGDDLATAISTAITGATATWDGASGQLTITADNDADGIQIDSASAGSLTSIGLSQGTHAATPASSTPDSSKFTLQIGANENQTMTLEFTDMTAAALGITGMGTGFTTGTDVTNGTDDNGIESGLDVVNEAGNAITVIENALTKVSAERSKMGAYQNRLEHTINNLETSSENLTAAESRIRDVDMAKEMMEMTKNNILSQAAQSMLAQANQQPQGVLQLLR
ncbi:flagellin [Cytobacillus sp. IB215665]|uniref:flagellin N-terminal helical domain-containing protein n=1 Tax=Cytobacillus sp. IB215665 TaxID=3097357 RepID=UPI002A0DE31E|nr:flagellin [Cytobacillus sp. IB215665]MDX8363825.1 flagellin [Cytobacillus sp. IB215665]